MPRYTFTVDLSGSGDNQETAWSDAVDAFSADPGEPTTAQLDEDDEEPEGDAGRLFGADGVVSRDWNEPAPKGWESVQGGVMLEPKTVSVSVGSERAALKAVDSLVRARRWFASTPFPDDEWEIEMKNGESPMPNGWLLDPLPADEWPTCRKCGSNLAYDDDVEQEICASSAAKRGEAVIQHEVPPEDQGYDEGAAMELSEALRPGSTEPKIRPLWKSSIVIWSEDNPQEMELSHLAREAESGDCYCSRQEAHRIEDPQGDPDWDGTEFFGVPDDELTSEPEVAKDATGGAYERTERAQMIQARKTTHDYSDVDGNGFCFECGLAPDHPEANHTTSKPLTINLTPKGCETLEGRTRVRLATAAFENATANVANLATQYFESYGMVTDPDAFDDCEQLRNAIHDRGVKQHEFLRAVAGAPKTSTEILRDAVAEHNGTVENSDVERNR